MNHLHTTRPSSWHSIFRPVSKFPSHALRFECRHKLSLLLRNKRTFGEPASSGHDLPNEWTGAHHGLKKATHPHGAGIVITLFGSKRLWRTFPRPTIAPSCCPCRNVHQLQHVCGSGISYFLYGTIVSRLGSGARITAASTSSHAVNVRRLYGNSPLLWLHRADHMKSDRRWYAVMFQGWQLRSS